MPASNDRKVGEREGREGDRDRDARRLDRLGPATGPSGRREQRAERRHRDADHHRHEARPDIAHEIGHRHRPGMQRERRPGGGESQPGEAVAACAHPPCPACPARIISATKANSPSRYRRVAAASRWDGDCWICAI
jgi:hypothetical protein